MENKLTTDMRKLLLIAASVLLSLSLCMGAKPKKVERRAVYETSIDCAHCVRKVTENVSFEKGVEDLQVKLDDKTVTIVYNPAKTDTLKLRKAITGLGYKARLLEDKAL